MYLGTRRLTLFMARNFTWNWKISFQAIEIIWRLFWVLKDVRGLNLRIFAICDLGHRALTCSNFIFDTFAPFPYEIQNKYDSWRSRWIFENIIPIFYSYIIQENFTINISVICYFLLIRRITPPLGIIKKKYRFPISKPL